MLIAQADLLKNLERLELSAICGIQGLHVKHFAMKLKNLKVLILYTEEAVPQDAIEFARNRGIKVEARTGRPVILR